MRKYQVYGLRFQRIEIPADVAQESCLRQTSNIRSKLRISQIKKRAAKNSAKQLL